MRGVDVISPAIRVRIVKYAKCYFLSNNVNVSKMIRILSSLCRYRSTPDSANAMDIPLTYCTSLIGSFNVYNSVCLSNSRCTTYAAICDNTSHRSKYSGSLISLSNNVWRSVQVLGADYMPDRHLIHTSSLWSSDSLGTDSTGHDDSATSAKKQFEKWKASIDFDLLTESHMRIHNSHMKAVEENKETYTDPVSDFEVFTIMTHLLRGSCCGNVCRHCPYGHVNAPKEYKELMRYNTAFYH